MTALIAVTEPDHRVCAVLARLRRRGLEARLATYEYCGECDIRICVRGERTGASAELLCCAPGDPQPQQWHAVRLTGDERTVWSGPACDDELYGVVDFVEELLVLDEAALSKRYERLG